MLCIISLSSWFVCQLEFTHMLYIFFHVKPCTLPSILEDYSFCPVYCVLVVRFILCYTLQRTVFFLCDLLRPWRGRLYAGPLPAFSDRNRLPNHVFRSPCPWVSFRSLLLVQTRLHVILVTVIGPVFTLPRQAFPPLESNPHMYIKITY